MDRKHHLQASLHAAIPITAAMGIRVEELADRCVTLSAPLAPNLNHTRTAFAGSVNALATITGWCAIWHLLDTAQLNAVVMIQDSTISYRRPITGDFEARCCLPDEADVARFLATLRRRGRARLELHAEVSQAGGLAVSFSGRYVAERAADPRT